MSLRLDDLDEATRAQLASTHGIPKTGKKSPDSIADDLFARQLVLFRLPQFHRQYRFVQSRHPDNRRRRWIADYCNLDYMLMVEVDGGIWSGGAHGHPVDITRNMMKQNDAALLGFQTLRFATKWIANKHAIGFLQRYLFSKGWTPNT